MDPNDIVWVVGPPKVRNYLYKPQPDITVWELAMILPLFHMSGDRAKYIENLPPEVRRHFVEVE